jgi:hypothetical protein
MFCGGRSLHPAVVVYEFLITLDALLGNPEVAPFLDCLLTAERR